MHTPGIVLRTGATATFAAMLIAAGAAAFADSSVDEDGIDIAVDIAEIDEPESSP